MTISPPGPKGHWLGGNLPDFRRNRLDFLTRCARAYGDVVRFRLGPRRIWLLNHPDLVEDVLLIQSRHFIKHFALRLNPIVLGNGLLTSEGDSWLRQRRLIQPVFQKSRINGYAADMVEITQRHTENWRPGEVRDVHLEMMAITLDIAARTLFHADVDSDVAEVARAMQVMQEHFVRRFAGLVPIPSWVPTPANLRFRRAVRRLDDVLFRFIRQRRQQPGETRDLLSLLLHARDESGGMSDRQLRDEAMTLFLAGHETTALALSWSWYLLATHPEAARKTHEEVDRVLAGRPPAAADGPHLRYVEWVALEAMRLYPPAYVIGREAVVDVDLGGYRLPRGTTVMMSQWVMHRDGRFFAEPETFRPERWANENGLPKYAYFPFGGGPRLCIGNGFAMLELVLVLATLAQRFHFTLQQGVDVRPLPHFTLRPTAGIPAPVMRRG